MRLQDRLASAIYILSLEVDLDDLLLLKDELSVYLLCQVLKVGDWSVRKLPDNLELTFAARPPFSYVSVRFTSTRRRVESRCQGFIALWAAQVQAPQALVDELESPEPPLYRRILLGAKTEALALWVGLLGRWSQVPLRMARDILEALREDVGLFPELQARFSELPGAERGFSDSTEVGQGRMSRC